MATYIYDNIETFDFYFLDRETLKGYKVIGLINQKTFLLKRNRAWFILSHTGENKGIRVELKRTTKKFAFTKMYVKDKTKYEFIESLRTLLKYAEIDLNLYYF